MDIAASIQSVTEDIVLKISRYLFEKYKIENLCMAGGVALNCVANGVLKRNKIFKDIWIQPASGDAGGSLGAALLAYYDDNNERIIKKNTFDNMKSSLLGPSFNDNEVITHLNKLNAKYYKYDEEKIINITSSDGSKEKWSLALGRLVVDQLLQTQ